MENDSRRYSITCALCEQEFTGFITHSHLRAAHGMTVAAYRALGHPHTNEAFYRDIGARKAGARHPYWKGGRYVFGNGYVYVRRNKRYELEHRVVMEDHLGRPLTQNETVHHRDGDRRNNAVENLELRTNSEHVADHLAAQWGAEGSRRNGKARVEATCDHCGRPISQIPSRFRAHRHHFCSATCHYAFGRPAPL